MNILSLFDGMSCLQIALNRLGVKYDNCYASEIDKYATQVTQHNYPNTIQLGDITKWKEWNLPHIDLVAGGSPCQGFSMAGKGLNFDDPRSKLYFVFEDIVKHYKPDYWLLENVVMLQEHQDIISQRLGIKPTMINSALVSAQNRERLYWTNIGNEYDLFGYPYCNIQQPKDNKIVLADIIEDGFVDRKKSLVLQASTGGPNLTDYFERNKKQIVFILQRPRGFNKGGIKAKDGKVPTLDANSWENNNHLVIQGAAKRGRGERGNVDQQIELNYSSKSNALTSVQKDSLVSDGIEHRKLTPLECERLQTVPDNYTLVLDENGKQLVSNNQRHKMLGNGWTIDVICHILSHIKAKQLGEKEE